MSDPAEQQVVVPVGNRILDRTMDLSLTLVGRNEGMFFLAWEPSGCFVCGCPDLWLAYFKTKHINLDLHEVV